MVAARLHAVAGSRDAGLDVSGSMFAALTDLSSDLDSEVDDGATS
jgi:hypothetical protein